MCHVVMNNGKSTPSSALDRKIKMPAWGIQLFKPKEV